MLGPVISQIWPDFCAGPGERSQALAMNGWPSRFSACSTTGCRPPSIGKAERAIDLGPHVIVVDREFCQRGRDVEQRERMRGGAQIVAGGQRHRAEPLEDFQFQPERAVAGIGDLGFDLAEFGGGEANLPGQRLAMDEGRVQRRRHQLVAVLRGDLDEIAEHVVVADLRAP